MKKQKVESLRYNLSRALDGKLTRNFTVCGFYILCPKNKQDAKITFNGHFVGEIIKDKIVIYKFNPDHWGRQEYKYDILVNIQEELHPEEVGAEKPEIKDEEKTKKEKDKLKDKGSSVREGNSESPKEKKTVSKGGNKPKRK